MTIVTSPAWLTEAAKYKSKRDAAREDFVGKMGLKPLKSLADLSLSPSTQLPIVQGLLSKANPQGSGDIAAGLKELATALVSTGLGQAGPMADVGETLLDFGSHVPQQLRQSHFMEVLEDD
ncbi:hypothetical protein [Pseudovibrio sp. POLY-S9]|uniref:hypothetical protein n=1 Tax=Pseudovibrio sp. POLY-S9 TaxID=1576596 RepID=UPI00070A3E82|nr:hypothetical protein [Pseudovibrio sp. POLY-S9]